MFADCTAYIYRSSIDQSEPYNDDVSSVSRTRQPQHVTFTQFLPAQALEQLKVSTTELEEMKTTPSIFSLALLCSSINTEAETLKCAYLDKENNVHIKHLSGLDVKITKTGNATSLKFAPDNETVAWLVMNTWVAEGDTEPQSEELKIYKNGLIRSIKCPLFIRDHWFWQNGSQIAIDCGGRHFAGWEILYDVTSLRAIATVDEAQVPLEKRPDWSLGDN